MRKRTPFQGHRDCALSGSADRTRSAARKCTPAPPPLFSPVLPTCQGWQVNCRSPKGRWPSQSWVKRGKGKDSGRVSGAEGRNVTLQKAVRHGRPSAVLGRRPSVTDGHFWRSNIPLRRAAASEGGAATAVLLKPGTIRRPPGCRRGGRSALVSPLHASVWPQLRPLRPCQRIVVSGKPPPLGTATTHKGV